MHLDGVASTLYRAVEHDQDALARRFIVGGDAHGLQEVHRAIGTHGRRGAHGPRQHDWLLAVDRQMQEICCLLHRIRAVCDDDAIDVLSREQRIATRGEAQPDHFPHVLAVNGGNLLAFHLCIAADLRHSRQEICNADGSGLIPCRRLF